MIWIKREAFFGNDPGTVVVVYIESPQIRNALHHLDEHLDVPRPFMMQNICSSGQLHAYAGQNLFGQIIVE
jgi:hypothetical protein